MFARPGKSVLPLSQAHEALFAFFSILAVRVQSKCLIHHKQTLGSQELTSEQANCAWPRIHITVQDLRVACLGCITKPAICVDHQRPVTFFGLSDHSLARVFNEVDLGWILLVSALSECLWLWFKLRICHAKLDCSHLFTLFNQLLHYLLVKGHYAVVSFWLKCKVKLEVIAVDSFKF